MNTAVPNPTEDQSDFVALLQDAARRERAIGAFTAYDTWQLRGIVDGAATVDAPVIVLVSPSLLASPTGRATVAAFVAFVQRLPTPAIVQADHLPDLELVHAAWDSGVQAVLADGSKLTPTENAAFAVASRRAAPKEASIGVEAELGRIDGNEDRLSAESAGKLTDPADVHQFLESSQADCLAVSIGNRHGAYSGEPDLDWERLAAIRSLSSVPLALHGASGLSDDELSRAVRAGISKVNFNAELRQGYFDTASTTIDPNRTALDLEGYGRSLSAAISRIVEAKLATLGWTP